MRIGVVGATGGSGRALVRLAQERGHRVAAVVRDRAGLGGLRPEAVTEARVWDAGVLASAFADADVVARVLRDANADMAEMENRIRASGLDWTIFRPPELTDRTGTGRYRERRDGNVRWGYTISRRDLAQAMLDALDDATAIRRTISVAAGGRGR